VVVVVDVLSFSTALTIAVERGAVVWPHVGGESAGSWPVTSARCWPATGSSHEGLTLSPESLLGVDAETRLVLPSPNGSSIAFAAINSGVPVVAGCLRNAAAVSKYLDGFERVALVPAGEQWGDGSLRPAYEDLVGAGAIIDRLTGRDPGLVLTPRRRWRCSRSGRCGRWSSARPVPSWWSVASRPTSGWPARSTRATWCGPGRGPLRPGLTRRPEPVASRPQPRRKFSPARWASGPHLGGRRRDAGSLTCPHASASSGPSPWRRPPCSLCRCRHRPPGPARPARAARAGWTRSAGGVAVDVCGRDHCANLGATGTATGRPFASPDFQLAVSSSAGRSPRARSVREGRPRPAPLPVDAGIDGHLPRRRPGQAVRRR
jgi:phosphosulfolactate phosphohydrolase-like enzyme